MERLELELLQEFVRDVVDRANATELESDRVWEAFETTFRALLSDQKTTIKMLLEENQILREENRTLREQQRLTRLGQS